MSKGKQLREGLTGACSWYAIGDPQSSSFWLDGRYSEAIQPFRTDSPLPIDRLGGETATSTALPLVSVEVAQLRLQPCLVLAEPSAPLGMYITNAPTQQELRFFVEV